MVSRTTSASAGRPSSICGPVVIWSTGYFGCRTRDGDFDADVFACKAARDAVRCVSPKLSQGAKSGIGGVPPGRLGARDKVATGADVVKRFIQGAGYADAARAIMFAGPHPGAPLSPT